MQSVECVEIESPGYYLCNFDESKTIRKIDLNDLNCESQASFPHPIYVCLTDLIDSQQKI